MKGKEAQIGKETGRKKRQGEGLGRQRKVRVRE